MTCLFSSLFCCLFVCLFVFHSLLAIYFFTINLSESPSELRRRNLNTESASNVFRSPYAEDNQRPFCCDFNGRPNRRVAFFTRRPWYTRRGRLVFACEISTLYPGGKPSLLSQEPHVRLYPVKLPYHISFSLDASSSYWLFYSCTE